MPALPSSDLAAAHLRRRQAPVFLVLVLGTLIASTPRLVAQQEPAAEGSTDAAGIVASAPPAAGWRIYRDPETGQLLEAPLPGQAEALAAKWQLRRAITPERTLRTFPIVLRGRTIGLGVALDDRFVTSTVLHRHPDGSQILTCVDGSHVTPPPTPLAER